MIVPSPTQCEAVRQWLIAALNTDDAGVALDPAPFANAAVFPGERDGPRERGPWARINTVALVSRGLCRSREGTGDDLLERRAEHREWTTSITVCSRLDPTARTLADEAAQHLQRALGAREGVATVLPNLRCSTGAAAYGAPQVQATFNLNAPGAGGLFA